MDGDHDDEAPLLFRRVDDVLGDTSSPVPAKREVADELMVVIGEEPATAEEAKRSKEWRTAMLAEMESIEHNRT